MILGCRIELQSFANSLYNSLILFPYYRTLYWMSLNARSTNWSFLSQRTLRTNLDRCVDTAHGFVASVLGHGILLFICALCILCQKATLYSIDAAIAPQSLFILFITISHKQNIIHKNDKNKSIPKTFRFHAYNMIYIYMPTS